jgi:hypothetical protein
MEPETKTKLPACVIVLRKGGSKKFETKVESLRFIARADVKELSTLEKKLAAEFKKIYAEKMQGKKMPKFIVQFKREDVLWTQDGEPYYLPTQWITDDKVRDRADLSEDLKKILTKSIFADEVTVLPEDRVETEVKKWSMLTEL